MRMFKVTISGVSHHEEARGRTAEEYQHYLTHVDGLKFVHVAEWVSGGAKQREKVEEES